jgi:hypothetical protein
VNLFDVATVLALRSRGMLKLSLAVIAAAAVAAVVAGAATADGPVAGTTFNTQCSFADGTTNCSQEIDIVIEGNCWAAASGFRLWEEDFIDSVRSYRGNAVLQDFNGVSVNADYSGVLRPHADARLIDDSGPHAFSSTFPVPDASCP